MTSFKEQHSCARIKAAWHSLFYKFYVYKQCVLVEAKQQLRRVNYNQF